MGDFLIFSTYLCSKLFCTLQSIITCGRQRINVKYEYLYENTITSKCNFVLFLYIQMRRFDYQLFHYSPKDKALAFE